MSRERKQSDIEQFLLSMNIVEEAANEEMDRLEYKLENVEQEVATLKECPSPQRKNQRIKIKERIEKLMTKFQNAKVVRGIDKVMFVLGFARIIFEAFLLGRAPCLYPFYHSVAVIVLVSLRYIYYRWMHWHYFLLDFCYWANFLILIFLWFFPTSQFIFTAIYSFSMGPLLIAIPLFNNSLVIHSVEKLTSSFIHLSPGLVTWSLRYHECELWPVAREDPTLIQYVINSAILYLAWALVYTVILKLTMKRCDEKNNTTMYKYMHETPGSFFHKATGILGEKLRPFTFMSYHIVFSLIATTITYITFHNHLLHAAIVILSILTTIWTAANYYMERFSKNYEAQLQQLGKIKDSLGIEPHKKSEDSTNKKNN
jgi:hypothetical protein